MDNKTPYSEKLEEKISMFFDCVPAGRLSRNLRRLLLSYLSLQPDAHTFHVEDLLVDIQYLFDLLDAATDELPLRAKS